MNPSINIQLGTEYLKSQLSNWDNDWSRTLAAYNAGPGRVHQWVSLSNFREPAEFVESIPFNETREYVQAVLRNADMYRQIYGERHPAALEVKDTSEVPAVTLSGLPAAAKTPGGGIRTTSATKPAPKAVKKTVVASKAVTQKKTTGSASKRSEAVAKHPAPKKKKTDRA
jgi:hypothetical protein